MFNRRLCFGWLALVFRGGKIERGGIELDGFLFTGSCVDCWTLPRLILASRLLQALNVGSRQHGAGIFNQIPEAFQRCQGAGRQQLAPQRLTNRAPQGKAGFKRDALQGIKRSPSNSARGGVDHAQQRNRVIRIVNDFQVRDHVLDFGTLVKRKSPDHVVLQLVATHGFFK